VASACKAGVCSVICSITADAFTVHGPNLVQAVRGLPVLHILSPMVRQIREMASRIPKRRLSIPMGTSRWISSLFHLTTGLV
jgi:hypothetical protein